MWLNPSTEGELPEDLKADILQTLHICKNFIGALYFIIQDAGQDPTYFDNHLLSFLGQDYLQSTTGIPMLVKEGIQNVGRRELRFILEMSIKLCFIQQKEYNSSVEKKLEEFRSTLNSSSISIKSQVELSMIPKDSRTQFKEEAGRLYGETSKYVHLSASQILERIDLINRGITSGNETSTEIRAFNSLLSRGLALSAVYLFHSVPEYVAGDFLVNSDGTSMEWYFSRSKYIAMIDEYFDYKHERQDKLEQVRKRRKEMVSF